MPLSGGFVSEVVRVGDTVRRRPFDPGHAPFVHRLLDHLTDWPGAPRFLGFDDQGRETLEFLDGWVPLQTPWIAPDPSLIQVATMVRELHDLTAGTALAADQEVICHNDLSPRNTVFRDLGAGPRPVAFIDWDIAAPGRRIHDVAHLCWQFLGLGPAADPHRAARQITLVRNAYGNVSFDQADVVETVLWWQDRCRRGIEAGAARGEAAMVALRGRGVPSEIREAYGWVRRHREVLSTPPER